MTDEPGGPQCSVVNRIVGVERHRNEILRIQERPTSVQDVVGGDWIDMMYVNRIKDFVTFAREVSSEISGDDMVTQIAPLPGRIERLIQMSLMCKRLFSNYAG